MKDGRGKKREPAHLQLVKGNPKKKSGQELTTRARRTAAHRKQIPTPPPHLSIEAKREWKRVCKYLESMGMITVLDRAILATYCAHYGRWVIAERKLKELKPANWVTETESGFQQKTPWLQIATQSMNDMNKAGASLGMNPIDREDVPIHPVDNGASEETEQSEEDSFFTTSA